MNKQKLAIILAIITAVGSLGGGAASGVITIDMFNTDNSESNVDNSETNISGDTVVNVDGEGLTCEDLSKACAGANLEGELKIACDVLGIICPG